MRGVRAVALHTQGKRCRATRGVHLMAPQAKAQGEPSVHPEQLKAFIEEKRQNLKQNCDFWI